MRRATLWLAVGLVLALASCGGGRNTDAPAGQSPGPALVVERYLQAANANDLDTMMELFGTADRTIDELDGRAMAERRMYVLASLLRHDDFSFRSQQSLPGRSGEAALLRVDLVQGGETVTVPFTVVRRRGGGWIIEQVDVEPLTAGG
ncbi:MAG: hypothetical protein P8177_11780 [Gemmatimonadota bacterium]|jgi:hypothetical protein